MSDVVAPIQSEHRNKMHTVSKVEDVTENAGVPVEWDTKSRQSYEQRSCRVCLGTDEDALDVGNLISPCSCSGTAKWVHTKCLLTWMNAVLSRGGNPFNCELCKQAYTFDDIPSGFRRRSFLFRSVFFYAAPIMLGIAALGFVCWDGGNASWLKWWLLIFAIIVVSGAAAGNSLTVATVAIGLLAILLGAPQALLMASGSAVAELRPGILLCFRPDGFGVGGSFARSVVLITEYSYNLGAVGYIINKPTGARPKTRWLKSVETVQGLEQALRFGFGGPVGQSSWEALHWTGNAGLITGASEIRGLPGVSVGGIKNVASSLEAAYHGPNGGINTTLRTLMVHGYAGWAPSQLDGEIRRGSWTIHNATAELIFDSPLDKMWEIVASSQWEGSWSPSH